MVPWKTLCPSFLGVEEDVKCLHALMGECSGGGGHLLRGREWGWAGRPDEFITQCGKFQPERESVNPVRVSLGDEEGEEVGFHYMWGVKSCGIMHMRTVLALNLA